MAEIDIHSTRVPGVTTSGGFGRLPGRGRGAAIAGLFETGAKLAAIGIDKHNQNVLSKFIFDTEDKLKKAEASGTLPLQVRELKRREIKKGIDSGLLSSTQALVAREQIGSSELTAQTLADGTIVQKDKNGNIVSSRKPDRSRLTQGYDLIADDIADNEKYASRAVSSFGVFIESHYPQDTLGKESYTRATADLIQSVRATTTHLRRLAVGSMFKDMPMVHIDDEETMQKRNFSMFSNNYMAMAVQLEGITHSLMDRKEFTISKAAVGHVLRAFEMDIRQLAKDPDVAHAIGLTRDPELLNNLFRQSQSDVKESTDYVTASGVPGTLAERRKLVQDVFTIQNEIKRQGARALLTDKQWQLIEMAPVAAVYASLGTLALGTGDTDAVLQFTIQGLTQLAKPEIVSQLDILESSKTISGESALNGLKFVMSKATAYSDPDLIKRIEATVSNLIDNSTWENPAQRVGIQERFEKWKELVEKYSPQIIKFHKSG